MILAIDPGPTESAYVKLSGTCVVECAKVANEDLLNIVRAHRELRIHQGMRLTTAVEMIASYGMAVGAEVFETCVTIGRICEALGDEPVRVKRIEVKTHICHSVRANDANIRQAVIDRYGGKDAAIGKKAKPGPLYGVSGDMWAALAVGLTVFDRQTMPIARAA
jgi:hypothetical protein